MPQSVAPQQDAEPVPSGAVIPPVSLVRAYKRTLANQVRMLYANGPVSVLIGAIAIAVLTILLYRLIPETTLRWWMAAAALVLCFRLALLAAFRRGSPRRAGQWRHWLQLWLSGIALSGLVWGAAAIWLFPPDARAEQLAVALVLTILCAVSVSVYAAVQGAFLLVMVPIALPLIAQFVRQGEAGMSLLAGLLLVFLATTARASYNSARLFNHLQELRRSNEELSYHASHDPLVELPNQREFRQRLAEAGRMFEQRREHYAVLFIDLDGFKDVNDLFGHATGDEVLKLIAEILRRRVRSSDTAARIGGDEFAVLLNPCPRDQAVCIAEQIRQDIAALHVAGMPPAPVLSASIGVAYSHDADHSPAGMMQAADLACYVAKHNGKDRISVHQADAETSVSGRFATLTSVEIGGAQRVE